MLCRLHQKKLIMILIMLSQLMYFLILKCSVRKYSKASPSRTIKLSFFLVVHSAQRQKVRATISASREGPESPSNPSGSVQMLTGMGWMNSPPPPAPPPPPPPSDPLVPVSAAVNSAAVFFRRIGSDSDGSGSSTASIDSNTVDLIVVSFLCRWWFKI